eukprot:TRINITY_DN1029_c0_g1_i1.p1 TRINITY_DN1029_c0_g1~~TRINITY_DN1029_c0_g1_i1.p1  ORF type:complete len:1042 (-),score=248.32 TRINITY_DN1029_c0_g1_i1:1596-4349(-)
MAADRRRFVNLPPDYKELVPRCHAAFNEYLKSERTYQKQLKSILHDYKGNLIAKSLIDQQDSKIIFGGLENIRVHHKTLYRKLRDIRDNEWPYLKSLGNLLLKTAPHIYACYADYARNQIEAKERLTTLCNSNSRVQIALQEMKSGGLEPLLDLPFAHINKIPQHLEKLATTMILQDNNYNAVADASAIFQQTSSVVAQLLQEAAALHLNKLLRQFVNEQDNHVDLAKKGRRLCRTGEVIVDKAAKRQAFLFNDLLVLAQEKIGSDKEKLWVIKNSYSLQKGDLDSSESFTAHKHRNNNYPIQLKFQDEVVRLIINPEEKMLWAKAFAELFNFWKKNNLFGIELSLVLEREGRTEIGVPWIVERLTKYVAEVGKNEEGLMRISGNLTEVAGLRDLFNQGEKQIDLDNYTLPSVCSCLKMFLRELPNPVIPCVLYDTFAKIQETTEDLDDKLDRLRAALELLPKANQNLLKFLIQFLTILASDSDKTKMTPQNLAIVLSPCLFRPLTTTLESTLRSPLINSVTEIFIEFYQEIFERSGLYPLGSPRETSASNQDSNSNPIPSSPLSYSSPVPIKRSPRGSPRGSPSCSHPSSCPGSGIPAKTGSSPSSLSPTVLSPTTAPRSSSGSTTGSVSGSRLGKKDHKRLTSRFSRQISRLNQVLIVPEEDVKQLYISPRSPNNSNPLSPVISPRVILSGEEGDFEEEEYNPKSPTKPPVVIVGDPSENSPTSSPHLRTSQRRPVVPNRTPGNMSPNQNRPDPNHPNLTANGIWWASQLSHEGEDDDYSEAYGVSSGVSGLAGQAWSSSTPVLPMMSGSSLNRMYPKDPLYSGGTLSSSSQVPGVQVSPLPSGPNATSPPLSERSEKDSPYPSKPLNSAREGASSRDHLVPEMAQKKGLKIDRHASGLMSSLFRGNKSSSSKKS